MAVCTPEERSKIATNKGYFKVVNGLHIMMLLLMLCRLSSAFFVMFGVRPPGYLQRLKIPRGQIWEYMWLLSLMASIMGLIAINRNKVFLMKHYVLGIITFGFIPILYAIYDLADEMITYYDTKKATQLFAGIPVVMLWAVFLTIATQIHGFGLYFAYQLIKVWQARIVQKKAK